MDSKKLLLVSVGSKSTSGKFLSFSEEDLTSEVLGKQIVIARQQVYRIAALGKNRKRNALIGTGVGAGVGDLMPASKQIYRAEAVSAHRRTQDRRLSPTP